MYWGETHLNLPVLSPQELLAQAKTMQVADQPGEREFAEYMADSSGQSFKTLFKQAGLHWIYSATDDIEGRNVPLDLADLKPSGALTRLIGQWANPDHSAGSSDRVTTNGQSAG